MKILKEHPDWPDLSEMIDCANVWRLVSDIAGLCLFIFNLWVDAYYLLLTFLLLSTSIYIQMIFTQSLKKLKLQLSLELWFEKCTKLSRKL